MVIQLARSSTTLLCTIFFLVTQEIHNSLPGALDDISNLLHRVYSIHSTIYLFIYLYILSLVFLVPFIAMKHLLIHNGIVPFIIFCFSKYLLQSLCIGLYVYSFILFCRYHFYFRTTILPQPALMEDMLERLFGFSLMQFIYKTG
uniref:Product n=1 Tax=Heterorhabditis bacteriophora TaxID=37862 RepID=A0A1I7W7I7_HETBA